MRLVTSESLRSLVAVTRLPLQSQSFGDLSGKVSSVRDITFLPHLWSYVIFLHAFMSLEPCDGSPGVWGARAVSPYRTLVHADELRVFA